MENVNSYHLSLLHALKAAIERETEMTWGVVHALGCATAIENPRASGAYEEVESGTQMWMQRGAWVKASASKNMTCRGRAFVVSESECNYARAHACAMESENESQSANGSSSSNSLTRWICRFGLVPSLVEREALALACS